MGVREFHAARLFNPRFFNPRPELLPRLVQSACVHLADDKEMGDGRPALGCAFRHQTGDWTTAANRGGRRGGFGFRGGEDVGSEDFSARARSADIGEIDAAFVRETPPFWGNLYGTGCAGRPRRPWVPG